jgi:predicted nucleic acid-binding protein
MIDAAVADSSVALKWVVQESDSDQAELLAAARLEAPDLLLVECANALWRKTIQGELQVDEALESLAWLRRAPVCLESSAALLDAALELAAELNHPVYDCVYLSLAIRSGVPLVTADRRLLSAVGGVARLRNHVILLSQVSL